MPKTIALALSFDRPIVTLRELQTDYSVKDLHDLLEVGLINAHNARAAAKRAARRRKMRGE